MINKQYKCYASFPDGQGVLGYNPLVVRANSKDEARRIAKASLPSCSRWRIEQRDLDMEKNDQTRLRK